MSFTSVNAAALGGNWNERIAYAVYEERKRLGVQEDSSDDWRFAEHLIHEKQILHRRLSWFGVLEEIRWAVEHHAEVARRAYFIYEYRQMHGMPGSKENDWRLA